MVLQEPCLGPTLITGWPATVPVGPCEDHPVKQAAASPGRGSPSQEAAGSPTACSRPSVPVPLYFSSRAFRDLCSVPAPHQRQSKPKYHTSTHHLSLPMTTSAVFLVHSTESDTGVRLPPWAPVTAGAMSKPAAWLHLGVWQMGTRPAPASNKSCVLHNIRSNRLLNWCQLGLKKQK